jgi:hypothetical protein
MINEAAWATTLNIYAIVGALEDNWNIYWTSLVSRLLSTVDVLDGRRLGKHGEPRACWCHHAGGVYMVDQVERQTKAK